MRNLLQVFFIAIALAMDAVSVSVAIGVRSPEHKQTQALRLAIFFGGFQAFMPVLGWLIGSSVAGAIENVSNPIACVLLSGIGIKMIVEAIQNNEEVPEHPSNRKLFGLAIATSIDALIVGTTLRFTDIPLTISILIIGIVTAILCYLAYLLSRHLGKLFGSRVELVGGILLIVIGFTFLFR